MTIRAEKITSLLFALYFAWFLKSTLLGYPTEPKVIGGIDLDRPISPVMSWTPIYFPMLLSGAFAYWIWPTKSYASLTRKMAAGSFALIRVTFATLFISLLCLGFGEFYLMFPMLMKSEIPLALAAPFLVAFQGTAIMGLFHGVAFVAGGIFFGCLIVLIGHAVSKLFGSPPPLPSGERARLQDATRPTWSMVLSEWPWPNLLAGLVAVPIVLVGFVTGGPFILPTWVAHLLPWGLVWIAVGAGIGYTSRQWAWCVAVSLPIGYVSSTMHATPAGFLASQSIDFPPVLLATLIGFSLTRKFVRRQVLEA
jgi:hypothetical protein